MTDFIRILKFDFKRDPKRIQSFGSGAALISSIFAIVMILRKDGSTHPSGTENSTSLPKAATIHFNKEEGWYASFCSASVATKHAVYQAHQKWTVKRIRTNIKLRERSEFNRAAAQQRSRGDCPKLANRMQLVLL